MRFLTAGIVIMGAAALPAGAQPIPLLHYSFDDQANPTANLGSLGAAQDGAIGGGIAFVPFAGGWAAGFDSVEDGQVRPMGDENAFDIADGDHSIMVTITTTNSEPGAQGGRFVVNKEKLGSEDGWAMTVVRDGGRATYSLAADGAGVGLTSLTPVNDGATHQIIGARRDGWLLLAVDGVVEAWTEIPASFGSTAQNNLHVSIGGRANFAGSPTSGPNDEFLGTIDDVAIYDVAIIDVPCYADCDRSGGLDFFDFLCFQNDFAAAAPEADCDESGGHDFFDFLCFQNAFAAGCP